MSLDVGPRECETGWWKDARNDDSRKDLRRVGTSQYFRCSQDVHSQVLLRLVQSSYGVPEEGCVASNQHVLAC